MKKLKTFFMVLIFVDIVLIRAVPTKKNTSISTPAENTRKDFFFMLNSRTRRQLVSNRVTGRSQN